jgi:thioredoxin-related protein
MAREVFPQPAVGEFFNKNFLNVAVQFDVTKKDGQEVKNWYKDAAAIAKNYKINSYPTYLFFNPAGELVHSIHSAIPVNICPRRSGQRNDPSCYSSLYENQT